MKTITYDETKWRLVPVEPTKEMVDAGCAAHSCEQGDTCYGAPDLSRSDCIDIYTEMLSGAPTPLGFGDIEDIEARRKDSNQLLSELRAAVVALAHAAENDKTYRPAYERASSAIDAAMAAGGE